MLRFGLGQVGRFALGLLGVALVGAAISALAASPGHYLAAVLARFLDIAQLNFGTSALTGEPAVTALARRLPATLELLSVGFAVAIVIGVPVGLALSGGRALRAGAPLIQIVAAAPVFCASLALVYAAVNLFDWKDLSYTGTGFFTALFSGDTVAMGHAFRVFAWPALIVGGAGAACVHLAIGRATAETADEPYRQGLRLMGLSAFEIDWLYAAPQVTAHLLSDLGEIARALIAAAVVVESVFGWPGAAELFVKSVALHDWNAVSLTVLLFASIALAAESIGNLAAHALARTEPKA